MMFEMLMMVGPAMQIAGGLLEPVFGFVVGWVPLIVAGAAAAGAATGAGIQLAKKVGKNNTGSTAFGDYPGRSGSDPNAPFFGGVQGGAQQFNAEMGQKASAADMRAAPVANYGQANQDRRLGLDARQGQNAAAQMMLARASGATPSIAQMQGDRQMQQVQAAQAAQAASARGPAGMALAQQGAANNIANAQGAISGQTQINAAQERLAAEQAAAGAYGQLRGGDLQSQGQSAQQAQFQAGQQLQSRALNDQRSMGYERMGADAYTAEMNARTQNQATLARSYDNAQTLNQNRRQENAKNERSLWDKLIPSDMNAKQPLASGDLYGSAPLAANSIGNSAGGQQQQQSGIDPTQAAMLASQFTSDTRAKAIAKGWDDEAWRTYDPAGYAKAHRVLQRGGQASPHSGSAADRADIDYIRSGRSQADDVAFIRDGAYPEQRPTEAMLDDRYDQIRGGAAEDVIGRDALDKAIGQQVEKDAPTAQWERSFGSSDDARSAVRESDNRAEAAKIRAGFEKDSATSKGMPWWATPVADGILSDNRAKLDEARLQGRMEAVRDMREAGVIDDEFADDDELAPPGPSPLPPPRIPMKEQPPVTSPGGAFRRPTEAEGPASPSMLPRGGANRAVEASNRSMVGSPYAYKPGLTPPEQRPGEPNFGPMAQNMEKSPVAGTAVKTDPHTGMKSIDRDKALKVTMSGVANLQTQLDQMKRYLGRGGRK